MISDLLTFTTIVAIAFTITVTPACDAAECPAHDGGETNIAANRLVFAAPAGATPPTALSFREQGPPQNLVITEYGDATIKRSDFAKLIMSADGLADPPLTCTLSWYQPDTTKPDRVLGLGCSMMATFKLFEFYRTVFEDNGGVPVP